jgi:hypothetical protein
MAGSDSFFSLPLVSCRPADQPLRQRVLTMRALTSVRPNQCRHANAYSLPIPAGLIIAFGRTPGFRTTARQDELTGAAGAESTPVRRMHGALLFSAAASPEQ